MDPQITKIIIFALISGAVVLSTLALAWASRPRSAAPSRKAAEADERLMRMEHAIDAIAIEVERIAEAQRFTAKLMSDRLAALPDQRPAERIVTPH